MFGDNPSTRSRPEATTPAQDVARRRALQEWESVLSPYKVTATDSLKEFLLQSLQVHEDFISLLDGIGVKDLNGFFEFSVWPMETMLEAIGFEETIAARADILISRVFGQYVRVGLLRMDDETEVGFTVNIDQFDVDD